MIDRPPHRTAGAERGASGARVLAAILVVGVVVGAVTFAVHDRGHEDDTPTSVAPASDATLLRRAEASYRGRHGRYGTVAQLQSGGFLTAAPTTAQVVVSADRRTFVVGRTAALTSTSGPLFLAASNTTPPFTFLAPDFSATRGAIQLTFGASSALAATANTPSNPSVLFASADEANVDATIATTDRVAGGAAGTCTTTCAGIGATKVEYAVGRLVVFSCRSGGRSLAPAARAPSCAAPATGFLPTPPKTAADVVALLRADATVKVAIANPGPVPPGSSPPTAPYGLAAYQALTSPAAGGGGLSAAQFDALHASGQIVYGTNVTDTQDKVLAGSVQMAMLPRSFVVSPSGDDTDHWTVVAASLHRPIAQWAVVLDKPSDPTYATDKGTAQAFLAYLRSAKGQAVLAGFGYDPLP